MKAIAEWSSSEGHQTTLIGGLGLRILFLGRGSMNVQDRPFVSVHHNRRLQVLDEQPVRPPMVDGTHDST